MILLHEILTVICLFPNMLRKTFVICLNSGNCPVMGKHFIYHDISTVSKHVTMTHRLSIMYVVGRTSTAVNTSRIRSIVTLKLAAAAAAATPSQPQ
jgi:hypothetical protein